MRIRWRGLELPNRVVPDRATLADTYGKFVIEPFERGFGMSIGTSLRRILLSALEGSAITRVKIQGVQHEISTIPGVVEDVTDIILNVKSLVVKNSSDQPRTIRIDRHELGPVKAGHIITDEAVQIINPEHTIATLTDDVPFVMEMTVENGRGYHPSDEDEEREHEVGVIPIDANFSPVVHVKHEVHETRVGQRTNYDRLDLEIWTNGTISPHMALVEAAKIMRKHLNPFLHYSEPGGEMPLDGSLDSANGQVDSVDSELERKLNMSLAELNLSVRATNCLESEGITTVRDLVIRNDQELLEVRNFGDTTLKEVKSRLAEWGLQLGMKLPSHIRR